MGEYNDWSFKDSRISDDYDGEFLLKKKTTKGTVRITEKAQ